MCGKRLEASRRYAEELGRAHQSPFPYPTLSPSPLMGMENVHSGRTVFAVSLITFLGRIAIRYHKLKVCFCPTLLLYRPDDLLSAHYKYVWIVVSAM